MTRRKRKILLGSAIALGAVLLLLIAFPVWFPWILRPIARSRGLNYEQFERSGYSRFIVRNVTFTNKTVSLKAARMEGVVPSVYLWQRNFGGRSETRNFFALNDWQLDLMSRGKDSPTNKPAKSVYEQFQAGAKTISVLRSWLPRAALSNGIIRAGGKVFQVKHADWRDGQLNADLAAPDFKQSASVQLIALGTNSFGLNISSNSSGVTAALVISGNESGLQILSTNFWHSNRFELSAHFDRANLLPDTASLRSDSFAIPADLIRLTNYDAVRGSMVLQWTNAQFALDIAATAKPFAPSQENPPLKIAIHASGDTNQAVIGSGKIIVPGIAAEVSEGIRLNFSGPLLSDKASLKILADFDKQPWIALRGKMSGVATFTPTAERFPTASFNLAGANIEGFDFNATNVQVSGNFDWPILNLQKTEIQFADASAASLIAKYDVQRRVIEGGHIQSTGKFGRQFLPGRFDYETATLSAEFSGPLTNVSHQGELSVANFSGGKLKPTGVRISWQGEAKAIRNIDILATAHQAKLALQGAIGLGKTNSNVTVNSLTLQSNRAVVLQLAQAFSIALTRHPADASAKAGYEIRMNPFELVGPGKFIKAEGNINWPVSGNMTFLATNISPQLLAGFLQMPPDNSRVDWLDIAVDWNHGPVRSKIVLSGTATLTNDITFSAQLNAGGDENGFAVGNFSVVSESETIFTATGFLPLTLVPSARDVIQFNSKSPLQLSAFTKESPIFWSKVEEWTRIEMESPNAHVELEGDWENPHGQIQLNATKIKLPELKTRKSGDRLFPDLEDIQISVVVDEQTARLDSFNFAVEKQPVTITGEVPLGREFWRALLKKPALPDWRKANARVQIADAEVAPFIPMLPKVLSPQGKLKLDLTIKPNVQLDGELVLKDLRTRPLAGSGVIHDVQAKLRFAGSKVILEEATGIVGNDFLNAKGEVSLDAKKLWANALPVFALTVTGDNIPLARTPDAIVRADLSLSITNSPATQPVIFGTVNLRNSYYLSDVRKLVPGRLAKVTRRPPYFSVEDEPFSKWLLNLQVTGENFLRVRSPLFRGLASANFKLSGTLKEPVALGDVKIESGAMRFPFASLRVEQGFVSLTSENPFRPQLFVTAATKKYGYDVRMQTHGPADQPIVEFSSVPALSSEEILLMLTSGEAPANTTSFSTEQRAQGVALFVGKGLLTSLGFGSEDSEERLTVRSGEQVTETGQPTLGVEYKLTEDWSLVGEYDRFNAYNVGLKWRVFSK